MARKGLRELARERGLAGRFGAEDRDPAPEHRLELGEEVPEPPDGVAPDVDGMDGRDRPLDVVRDEHATRGLGERRPVRLGRDDRVAVLQAVLPEHPAPHRPEVGRVGRLLRDGPVEAVDADAGEVDRRLADRLDPLGGERLARLGADQHVDLVLELAREPDELEVPDGRREGREEHERPGHRPASRDGSTARRCHHARNPRTAVTRNSTYWSPAMASPDER